LSVGAASNLRVAVVGGGITGLTTAYRLARAGVGHVTLLEGRARLGGNIVTERRDGFVIDGGPDSFVANKPQASAAISASSPSSSGPPSGTARYTSSRTAASCRCPKA
jgi:protoporphyrinogen oxidase